MTQNGPRMTQNDPKWPKNDAKWTNITPNGPKMSPGFTHFSAIFFLLKSGSANFFAFKMYAFILASLCSINSLNGKSTQEN